MQEPGRGGIFREEVFQETDCRTVGDVCRFMAQYVPQGVQMIETGTAYQYDPECPDHTTTFSFVKYIAEPLNGVLHSIDIVDREPFIEEMFEKVGADVKHFWPVVNDSVQAINNFYGTLSHKVSILCLDSAEDARHTVAEFRMAEDDLLADHHYVLVDDIHNANSVKYLDIIPLLQAKGYDWIQIPTPTGLFVAAKGYPVPRRR